jgi:VIT1/CCC1 family predicted Fe2+/Mn2+ transporter
MSPAPREQHLVARIGWLRAAVLGANDGIVSTASLISGVAAAATSKSAIVLAAVAALVAGAMSMAAGEYVSVSSQADTEEAEITKEKEELKANPEAEIRELAGIYMRRGVEAKLATDVAKQLMARDALAAHARDELGISKLTRARPVQAAFASAASFTAGAALPLVAVILSPRAIIVWTVAAASLIYLAILGALGARAGGASLAQGVVRVTFWGALAMAVTAGVGRLMGTAL